MGLFGVPPCPEQSRGSTAPCLQAWPHSSSIQLLRGHTVPVGHAAIVCSCSSQQQW